MNERNVSFYNKGIKCMFHIYIFQTFNEISRLFSKYLGLVRPSPSFLRFHTRIYYKNKENIVKTTVKCR